MAVPMTKEEFSNIKLMLANGFSIKKTGDIVKRSEPVIRKVEKSDNWDEYCGVKPEKEVENKRYVTSSQMDILTERMDKTNELLQKILELMQKYMEV